MKLFPYFLTILILPISLLEAKSDDCNSNGFLDKADVAAEGHFKTEYSLDFASESKSSSSDGFNSSVPSVTDVLLDGTEIRLSNTTEFRKGGELSKVKITSESFDNIVYPSCPQPSLTCLRGSGESLSTSFLDQIEEVDLNGDGRLDIVGFVTESYVYLISGVPLIGNNSRSLKFLIFLNLGDGRGSPGSEYKLYTFDSLINFVNTAELSILDSNLDGIQDILLKFKKNPSSDEVTEVLYHGSLTSRSKDENQNLIPDECEFKLGRSFAFSNEFLGMNNILEIVNNGLYEESSLNSEISLSSIMREGSDLELSFTPYQKTISFPYESFSQLDLILGSFLNLSSDSYGFNELQVHSEGDIVARNMLYRFKENGDVDYFFSSPFRKPLRERSFMTVNTFDPNSVINPEERGELKVENYLTIANLSVEAQEYTLSLFNINGESYYKNPSYPPYQLTLEPGQSTHLPISEVVFGMVSVEPKISHDYLAELTRYNPPSPGSNDYSFAFALPLVKPFYALQNVTMSSGAQENLIGKLDMSVSNQGPAQNSRDSALTVVKQESLYISVSRGGGAINWVEVANPSARTTKFSYSVYGSDGSKLNRSEVLSLDPFAQTHINASELLGEFISGQIVFTPLSDKDPLLIGGISYFSSCSGCEYTGAFVNEGVRASSLSKSVSYNSFLGFQNFLRLSNTTGKAQIYEIQLIEGKETRNFNLAANSSIDIAFVPGVESAGPVFNVPKDSYGKVTIKPIGNAQYIAQMLRAKFDDDFNITAATAYQAK